MSEWTVVLTGKADSPLATRLVGEHGLTVMVAPDLYDLPPGHLLFSAIDSMTGPVAVAGPYLPRATYWIVASGGVKACRADVDETKTDGKPLHPIHLNDCNIDEAVKRIVAITGEGGGMLRDFHESLPQRWYPVIDYDRCTNCFECVEFCLFGVYEIDGNGRVHVGIGDNCKAGCPACSRVCPAGAIIFPRFHDGGPIAGADDGRIEQLQGEAARQASAPDVKAYNAAYGDPDKPTPNEKPGTDLDKTIDDLETFEP